MGLSGRRWADGEATDRRAAVAGSAGTELNRMLFVGDGSAALADEIADWFPNQTLADHAAFANARGMLKYLQYVCSDPDGEM